MWWMFGGRDLVIAALCGTTVTPLKLVEGQLAHIENFPIEPLS
jgi:hypothetical protein